MITKYILNKKYTEKLEPEEIKELFIKIGIIINKSNEKARNILR